MLISILTLIGHCLAIIIQLTWLLIKVAFPVLSESACTAFSKHDKPLWQKVYRCLSNQTSLRLFLYLSACNDGSKVRHYGSWCYRDEAWPIMWLAPLQEAGTELAATPAHATAMVHDRVREWQLFVVGLVMGNWEWSCRFCF